jgi:hypothetical protein
MGANMKTSLICVGVGASLLFSVMGCQKEGVATSGSGGAQMGGSLGSGGAQMGGSSGDGGAQMGGSSGDAGPAAGGSSGVDGMAATGGSTALGGVTGAGGTFGAGGVPSSGGVGAAGGRVGTGGSVDGGGIDGGGMTGTGGKVGSGGAGGSFGTGGTGGMIGTGGALGGTGGTTAKTCGGIAGIPCPSVEFCELPVGACLKTPDIAGTCSSTGSGICSAIVAPVCGCDGKTYNNNCLRLAAGVSEASNGACVTPACPTDISQIAAWPCTEGLTCEYGTDPRPSCRPSATCTNGAWTTLLPPCGQLPVVTCPATRDAAAGQTCPTSGAYCVYSDLSCLCTSCPTTPPVGVCTSTPTWHCATPNTTAGCPAGIPLLGSACTSDGLTCTYSCGAGGARACKKNAWYTANGGACPL